MAEVTVKQLAQVVGTPVEKLLVQLKDAGVEKSGETDMVSDSEKLDLLSHLRTSRGETAGGSGASKKITLRRKRVSEKSDASGRRKVNVEVRGRRTIVKPPAAEAADEMEAEAASSEVDAVAQTDVADNPITDTPSTEAPAAPVAEAAEEVAAPAEAAAPEANETTREAAPESTDAISNTVVAADTQSAEAASTVSAEAAAEQAVAAQVAAAAAAASAAEPVAQAPVSEASTPNAPAAPAPAPTTASDRMRIQAEEQARAAAERQAEKQVAGVRRKETEETQKRESEAREQQRTQDEAQRRAAMEAQQAASGTPDRSNNAGGGRPDKKARKGKGGGSGGGGGGGGDTRYGRNQLHVAKGKSGRRKGKPRRALPANFEAKHAFERPTEPVVRDVEVPETITVAELGNRMAVKANEVIKSMMGMGVMATINQILDQDTAILVVEEMGHKAIPMSADDIEAALAERIAGIAAGEAEGRPPVVTIMGHVDHGKTSLLDFIRTSRVASGEAGGITQHIGAYQTETDNGVITFLDTPGHAAFSAMRQRGAQATDIVVLVVAGDDGVMPQTIEAVQNAKASKVPLIVAVNKMDKEGFDPERVRNELSQHEVISEEWGGETQFIPVSAITGEGVEKLLDAITLQSEVLELTAVAEGGASGLVIEASLDKGRGPVATVLVQQGILKRGDIIICGAVTGRVRAMFDEDGVALEEAGPSTPVQVLGLSSTPNAGDEMLVAADDKIARELATLREDKSRDARLAGRKMTKLEDVFTQYNSGVPSLNLLVKADVKGSFEAIRSSLEGLSTDEVSIQIVGGGVGGITESDAQLAATSNAILVGFNVRADSAARRLVQETGIDLRYYSVIYELIDLAKSIAGGMLPPEVRERIIGNAEVKEVFTSPKFGQIAGCMVVDGVVRKDEPIRVLRDSVVIYEGELESLRRFKDEVKDVHMGTECGIGVKNYTDVQSGDVIEVFERTEVARTL